jgi:hypothetical protein
MPSLNAIKKPDSSPTLFQMRAAAILALRERSDNPVEESTAYQQFKIKYRYNLKGFIKDCIVWEDGQGPADYQELFCEKFVERRRGALRGPHGLGKTAMAAWVVLWFSLTRDGEDWKLPTTASAWRQLTKFLWPEIRKWCRRLRWDLIGRAQFNDRELSLMSLKLTTGEAFALASDNPALIEGAHASNILYIFDEAKAIPEETFDAAEGALSTGEAYILAISTPGEPIGRFYDIHRRKSGLDDWYVLHVTKEMVVKAGRMDPHWAKQRRLQWGADSAVYKNRVEGEFASSDQDTVISLADVERAIERWHVKNDSGNWGQLTGLGVDVGRGGDPTVIAEEYGHRSIKGFTRTNVRDTMQVAGLVSAKLKVHHLIKAVIDILSMGAGVYDRLREFKEFASRVIPFVASAKSDMKDHTGELGFINLRAAAWWNMREILQRDEYDLPPDDKLIGDLTTPKWRLMSGGKIRIEEKEEIKKRLNRSTDDGDAVVQVAMKKNLSAEDSDMAGLGQVDDFQSRWK